MKQSNLSNSFEHPTPHRHKPCARGSFSPPRGILSRAINRLPKPVEQQIGPFANGVAAGSGRTRWLTRLAVGHRGIFPPAVRAQVTAIACSLPCQHHVPLSRWSRAEVARCVAQDRTLPPISVSTVGCWLKEEHLRPWRYHAWQHIH